MRVHADTHPGALAYLDGAFVEKALEADDAEGWVDVLMLNAEQPLPKPPASVRPYTDDGYYEPVPHPRWQIAHLTGAVRIALGDETGG